MRKLGIAIERQGYLQDEAISLFALKDAKMFTSWLDYHGVPHSLGNDGRIEVRIYAIRLLGPLARFIEHKDKDYVSEEYDLWKVDPKLFDTASFISWLAGTESNEELLEEAYRIWETGLELGIYELSMDEDELRDVNGNYYIGHFPSLAALLFEIRGTEALAGYDDYLDEGLALADIPEKLGIVEKGGYWFYRRTWE